MSVTGQGEHSHRRPWALWLYAAGMVLLGGYMGMPMYKITEVTMTAEPRGEGELVSQVTGIEFLGDAWRILLGSIQVGIPPLPSIPWWLVNAPVMLLVVLSAIPGAVLIWFAERSAAAAWLGRIWWLILFFAGPFWYLWQSGPEESVPIIYEQLLGINLMVFGTFLIAVSFWVARPRTTP